MCLTNILFIVSVILLFFLGLSCQFLNCMHVCMCVCAHAQYSVDSDILSSTTGQCNSYLPTLAVTE